MNESSNAYSEKRNRQQLSKTEEKNWPKGGWKALSRAAATQKRMVSEILKKKDLTTAEIYEAQKYTILYLYSKIAFRTEPASFFLEASKTENTLLRPKGSRVWVVTLKEGRYKTSKAYGEVKIPLPTALSKFLSVYIPKIKKSGNKNLSI